ncbi:HEAT repeat domain-containing protein [Janthinobacterium sp. 17J80-10]|uniref:HEAT repeat domain-containing protein n=1 Tax=Janthinobacterium sp. 17J80-10 TaxID=2497863 RepID=UPI0013E8BB20|nr:HEAT repeat domain-containing protein [Janthinobacterium sp. 17J80-10]
MASSTLSDPYIAAAFWTGLAALLLTILLALQIMRLRMALRRRERLEARALAKWRPLLNATVAGEPPHQLPPLLQAERLPLLKVWVHLQASMRGDAQEGLNALARSLALDALCREKLARGQRAERLLATLVLGYLRDAQGWPYLLRAAGEDDQTLAQNALWALARINPAAGAAHMMTFFIQQDDWAIARVVYILQEAREPAAEILAQMLPQLDDAGLTRGLRIAEGLRVSLPASMIAAALRRNAVPTLIAALRNASGPETLAEVRTLLAHDDWQVRLQAAKALGRLGSRNDAALLVPLLQDAHWWVRYRTAQSLLELPALSAGDIATLRASLSDRFARDMLAQVMAEKGMA